MSAPRTRRAPRRQDISTVAIGYVRVSTDGQVESGAGLDAQRVAITDRSAREGWNLELVADEGLSGASVEKRPALVAALDRLDTGEAGVLVASKLDRVSRSVADFAALLDRAQRAGWRIVLLDLGVDTSTPAGEFVSNTLASAAQYERKLIGARTREGLAAKRAAGVRLGRPGVDIAVVRRVVDDREAGLSLRGIAEGLTRDAVPTAQGGSVWRASSVKAVLDGQDGRALMGL